MAQVASANYISTKIDSTTSIAMSSKLAKEDKVTVNVPYLDFYLETCSFDEMGYLYPDQHHHENAPVLRLFIHPTFTVEAFEKFCCTYKNPSFQCYSRLLPFNTHSYVGSLILVDYFNYKCSIGSSRELNIHEQSLFKECQFFRPFEHNMLNKKLLFVESISEFMTNFEIRFKASSWIKAIDFNKFHISGGCIVNSLCKHSFPDTTIEKVDINFNGNSFHEFEDAVDNVYTDLTKIMSKNNHYLSTTLVKKSNGGYIIVLPFNIQLQFNFKNVPNNTNPVSYVLHSSDIDVSQVAFTGSRVFCTFAFLQAIATKSFICYTMHANMASNYSNCSEKRSSAEDINTETKKTRFETPILEQKTSMPSAASATVPKFVSAATMAAPVPEISDEELLKFTLEFERKHGI
ncbi:unnamed protein product [Rotaria sp. Silwood1]|nr:unnamed protein product [Rotaria sp. Silwood1]